MKRFEVRSPIPPRSDGLPFPGQNENPGHDTAMGAVKIATFEFCTSLPFTKARLAVKIDLVNPLPPVFPILLCHAGQGLWGTCAGRPLGKSG